MSEISDNSVAGQPIADDLSCVGCGYNLRTLTSTARCPECGVPVRETVAVGLLGFRSVGEVRWTRRSLAAWVIGIGICLVLYDVAWFLMRFYLSVIWLDLARRGGVLWTVYDWGLKAWANSGRVSFALGTIAVLIVCMQTLRRRGFWLRTLAVGGVVAATLGALGEVAVEMAWNWEWPAPGGLDARISFGVQTLYKLAYVVWWVLLGMRLRRASRWLRLAWWTLVFVWLGDVAAILLWAVIYYAGTPPTYSAGGITSFFGPNALQERLMEIFNWWTACARYTPLALLLAVWAYLRFLNRVLGRLRAVGDLR